MLVVAALVLAALPPEAAMWAEAGFAQGAELPRPTPTASVADFGAVADDGKDDTDAFERALAAGGAIAVPKGEFHLSRRLHVRKTGTVVIGAGSAATTLRFTRPLQELDPRPTRNTGGTATTQWSWSGGLLTFHAAGKTGASVGLLPARRGDRQVRLAAPLAVQPGQELILQLSEGPAGRLVSHLYAGDPGDVANLTAAPAVRISARVLAVEGEVLRLATPLPIDLPAEFRPKAMLAPPADNMGIRGVTFRLVASPYRGHFMEDGWNALEFAGVRHGWADDIRLQGVDSGIFANGAHLTLRGIVLEAGRPASRQGFVGHHGVSLGGCAHRLENFDFKARFHHDITFGGGANGHVVRAGRGKGLTLDFHKKAPFANLVTDVSSESPDTFFQTGGGVGLGRCAGGWNWFWNLRSPGAIRPPARDFAPPAATRFVGVAFAPSGKAPAFVAEALPEGAPADLWLAARSAAAK